VIETLIIKVGTQSAITINLRSMVHPLLQSSLHQTNNFLYSSKQDVLTT